MKTDITIPIPKDCYIACHIFSCSIEELLQFYVNHISIDLFLKDRTEDIYEIATYFFLEFTPSEDERYEK